jgi:hypothetical protein
MTATFATFSTRVRGSDPRMVRVTDIDRFVFVVGAPRCGTTTLSRFLKDHPAIRFPAVKEPHFFAQHDLRRLSDEERRGRRERHYLSRFRRDAEGRVGADCSVTYLYAPELLEPVLRLWPGSRCIIALRDPLTMLPSLHQRLLFMGDETLTSFAKAWAAVPDRAAGRRIPRGCVEPRWLRYDEAARFGTYLERLYKTVGKERCLPIIFDDLTSDPRAEYRKLMDFCGLDPVPGIDFAPQRSGKAVRVQWLQRMLKRPPAALTRHLAADRYLHRTGEQRSPQVMPAGKILSLRKRLLQWNKVAASAPPLPPRLQLELRGRFKSEIDKLGRLIGRELSDWLLPEEQQPEPAASRRRRALDAPAFWRGTA